MQILVAIRRGFALDLRHAPTDMWLSGTSAQVSSILAHSSNTANSKLAARYADASTENTLRAREALLPKLQPGNDDGTQWSPARRGSIVMAKTVDDISPRGWTLAHDTQAVTQIARHMVKVGAASDKTPFKMFWEWKNEMQTAGNSKWEPFPGMDSDWAPLFNTNDLDTKYEDNTKARNQLSHKIFGMNHERFCNWLISRGFEAHLQSHQRSFHSQDVTPSCSKHKAKAHLQSHSTHRNSTTIPIPMDARFSSMVTDSNFQKLLDPALRNSDTSVRHAEPEGTESERRADQQFLSMMTQFQASPGSCGQRTASTVIV